MGLFEFYENNFDVLAYESCCVFSPVLFHAEPPRMTINLWISVEVYIVRIVHSTASKWFMVAMVYENDINEDRKENKKKHATVKPQTESPKTKTRTK